MKGPMSVDKLTFSEYDFWAYLVSGTMLLSVIDLVAETRFLANADWSPRTAAVLILAYVLGHLVAELSTILFELLLVRKLLGYPRDVLFGQSIAPPWARRLFPAYFKSLSEAEREVVKAKWRVRIINGDPMQAKESPQGKASTEALFWAAFVAAKENPATRDRLSIFRNVYGFARNLALVAFVDTIILALSCIGKRGDALHGSLAAGALVMGIGMTYRYLAFFWYYGNEVFTTYAYSSGSQRDAKAA